MSCSRARARHTYSILASFGRSKIILPQKTNMEDRHPRHSCRVKNKTEAKNSEMALRTPLIWSMRFAASRYCDSKKINAKHTKSNGLWMSEHDGNVTVYSTKSNILSLLKIK